MHVRHLPQKSGDNYHLVALTSSTLVSLQLDPLLQNHAVVVAGDDQNQKLEEDRRVAGNNKPTAGDAESEKVSLVKEEFAMGIIEAKTWSHMIDCKMPKQKNPMTTVRTQPWEPEMIEMMAGLEDASPFRPSHVRSFSFHIAGNVAGDDHLTPRVKVVAAAVGSDCNGGETDTSSIELQQHVSKFNPDVIAAFRRALEDLPLANQFHLWPVEKPAKFDKLIVYFTSLHGVRKTYEDCCHVCVILKGLGVKVDERDVPMLLTLVTLTVEEIGEAVQQKCLIVGGPIK